MCYDTKSSLISWAIASFICVYLYFRNRGYDRWNAAFIMTLSTIQLLEAGLWISMDKKDENMNEILTKLTLIVLFMQPLVKNYAGYVYTQNDILAFTSWIFIGILIWSWIKVLCAQKGRFFTNLGPTGHLVWNDTKSENFLGGRWMLIAYLTGLFIPLLLMKTWKGYMLIMIGVSAVLLSLAMTQGGEISRYWCYTTVLYSIISLL